MNIDKIRLLWITLFAQQSPNLLVSKLQLLENPFTIHRIQ